MRKNLNLSHTIFAMASGALPAALAIVRLSGPESFSIADKVSRKTLPRDGKTLSSLFDRNGEKLDEALVLTFEGPHSFTGEDVVEFHCHGSSVIVSRLEKTLIDWGARPAERGEFSYRAFLNGKLSAMDLEALGDLYRLKQSADLSALYRRKEGSLEGLIASFRQDLIGLQAVLDTAIDFSEEYSGVTSAARERLTKVIHGCSVAIQRYQVFRGEKPFPRLVLAGRPNAGKSSLFNALLGRYRAIVHASPGTTRDIVEENVELGGRAWRLADTAGVRRDAELTEAEGIVLASQYLEACSLWVLVVDSGVGIQESEQSLLSSHAQKPHLVVWNKADLATQAQVPENLSAEVVKVSCLSGEGVPELWEYLNNRAVELSPEPGPLPSASQCSRLERVLVELEELETLVASEAAPEILAEKNRLAMSQLEAVIGDVDAEEILGRVFSDFCIGK